MAINKVKGTYDILPGESSRWTQLENLFREVCRLYNYKEIRTPIFEYSELFHRSVGEGSDLLRKETYDFVDRGDRNVTLRPEGTAGIVRAYVENKLYADGNIQKLFYMGPMFRYDRPQKGRYRQFSQFGAEVFGTNDPAIDAEIISTACTIIRAVGLKKIKVRLNSLGDDETRSNYREALRKHFEPHIKELCPDCQERLIKNPLRILDCKVDQGAESFKTAPKISDYLTPDAKEHFNSVLSYLHDLEIDYVIDENLVRGLDYYTNTIFEVEAQIEGFCAQNVLAGGGRYNHLVEALNGPDTPAIGFAFGIDRLMLAMEAENRLFKQNNNIHLFIIALGNEAKKEAVVLNNNMRIGGLVTDIDYQNRSLKGQFKLAENAGARFIAILGDNELANGTINVKDKTDDSEVSIDRANLYQYIVQKLKNHHGCQKCDGECNQECEHE